jgi:hypothetical protein
MARMRVVCKLCAVFICEQPLVDPWRRHSTDGIGDYALSLGTRSCLSKLFSVERREEPTASRPKDQRLGVRAGGFAGAHRTAFLHLQS